MDITKLLLIDMTKYNPSTWAIGEGRLYPDEKSRNEELDHGYASFEIHQYEDNGDYSIDNENGLRECMELVSKHAKEIETIINRHMKENADYPGVIHIPLEQRLVNLLDNAILEFERNMIRDNDFVHFDIKEARKLIKKARG